MNYGAENPALNVQQVVDWMNPYHAHLIVPCWGATVTLLTYQFATQKGAMLLSGGLKMKVILIKTDQTVSIKEISGFADLYSYYKGFPETVNPRRLNRPFCMLVDDSGRLHGLPVNKFGSMLYETDKHGNPIVGDVFLMKQEWGEDGYDLVGLTDTEIEQLCEKYGLKAS